MVAAAGRDGERGTAFRERPIVGRAGRLFALAVGGAVWASAALAQDIAGTWLTEGGRSQVRIAPCGQSRCGTIIWTKADAKDVNNPDLAKRDKSLIGLRLFSGGRPNGETWTGELYNPLDGRTYAGKMRLVSPSQLELSGCVLAGLICKSQAWTRLR